MNKEYDFSQLNFVDRFPLTQNSTLPPSKDPFPDPGSTLLVYDQCLDEVSREFKAWASRYPIRYAVESGETLKDLARFPLHVESLRSLAKQLSPQSLSVAAVGGGSVGDFAAFFASVYRRGVRLVHIPSTWLAAVDSSHGGKTALNCGSVKNLIGTIYPAEKIILVQSLLLHQPDDRVVDAMGELGKVALVDGGLWVHRLERTRLEGSDLLWKFLKPAIRAKMKVVEQDPLDQNGLRKKLSLGHTLAHIFESAYQWSHGFAVGQGLFFALQFSEERGILPQEAAQRASLLLREKLALQPEPPQLRISANDFVDLLLQDRKRSGQRDVTYVFFRGFGQLEPQTISVTELAKEARRQGWVQ